MYSTAQYVLAFTPCSVHTDRDAARHRNPISNAQAPTSRWIVASTFFPAVTSVSDPKDGWEMGRIALLADLWAGRVINSLALSLSPSSKQKHEGGHPFDAAWLDLSPILVLLPRGIPSWSNCRLGDIDSTKTPAHASGTYAKWGTLLFLAATCVLRPRSRRPTKQSSRSRREVEFTFLSPRRFQMPVPQAPSCSPFLAMDVPFWRSAVDRGETGTVETRTTDGNMIGHFGALLKRQVR